MSEPTVIEGTYVPEPPVPSIEPHEAAPFPDVAVQDPEADDDEPVVAPI